MGSENKRQTHTQKRAWAIFMLAGVNEQDGQRIASCIHVHYFLCVCVCVTWKGCRRDDGRKERCWSNRNSTATNDNSAAAFLLLLQPVELFFVFRSGSAAHWLFRFSLSFTGVALCSLLPPVVVLATALGCDDPDSTSVGSSSSPGQEDPGNWNTTRLRFTKLLNAFI